MAIETHLDEILRSRNMTAKELCRLVPETLRGLKYNLVHTRRPHRD